MLTVSKNTCSPSGKHLSGRIKLFYDHLTHTTPFSSTPVPATPDLQRKIQNPDPKLSQFNAQAPVFSNVTFSNTPVPVNPDPQLLQFNSLNSQVPASSSYLQFKSPVPVHKLSRSPVTTPRHMNQSGNRFAPLSTDHLSTDHQSKDYPDIETSSNTSISESSAPHTRSDSKRRKSKKRVSFAFPIDSTINIAEIFAGNQPKTFTENDLILEHELLETTFYIQKTSFRTLIDSGAQKNFISEASLKSIQSQTPVRFHQLKGHEQFFAKSFSGETQLITRYVYCSLEHASGLKFPDVKLHVSNLSFDILLGKPWHTLYNPRIDWKKNTLQFEDTVITAIRPDFVPEHDILSAKQFEKFVKDDNVDCFCVQFTTSEVVHVGSAKIENSSKEEKVLEAQLLDNFRDVFPDDLPFKLPPSREVNHSIDLTSPDMKPIARSPYRMSAYEISHLRKHLDFLLERGLIRPSCSPWAAPVLFVAKKNGKLRFCVDYRLLNKITIKNRFPLPPIDVLLDKLHGMNYFSSVDLQSAYHQVRINEKDIEKTAFTTPLGLYEFTVLPFGLCNAPSTFQTLMQGILGHLNSVVVYLDDILIFSKNIEEHERDVKMVLQILRENKLYASSEKSEFFKNEIKFLGHKILQGGSIAPDEDKLEAVLSWPSPRNVKQLQGFLGFVNFYRRFIKDLAKMSIPLFRLLRKDVPFVWDDSCQQAFEYLKNSLTSRPILRVPDPDRPFRIECDASDFAIGAVLTQKDEISGKWFPVAYFSRSLDPAERNYPVQEKELLALICSLRKWRHYVFGYVVHVTTDHQSLVTFLNHKNPSGRKARWLIELSEFPVEITYRKGTENLIADTLSRRPDYFAASSTVIDDSIMMKKIKSAYEKDPLFKDLLEYFTQCLPLCKSAKSSIASIVSWFQYDSNSGLIFYIRDGSPRLCIPRDHDILKSVVSEAHDSILSGHQNSIRTYKALQRLFYWPKMNKFITDYVLTCDSCQRNKISPIAQKPFLQPLQLPSEPWKSISMDFITCLPVSNGFDSIYVVVDRMSKMVHFIPSLSTDDAPAVAQRFVDNVVKQHGVPEEIVSDRDPKFTSRFWKELFNLLGTRLALSTSAHPETDGQTERTNRSLEVLLRHFVNQQLNNWTKLLAPLEFAYNSTINSLGKTPFEIVYGYNPPDFLSKLSGVSLSVPSVEEIQAGWLEIKDIISESQISQAKYANQHRTEVPDFKEGDWVLLSTKHLATKFRAKNAHKLQSPYIGPYQILKQVSPVAYKLKLPDNFEIHDVFYSGLLKRYVGEPPKFTPPPPVILSDNSVGYIVEALLRRRKKRNSFEYLVKWEGYPEHDSSWEPRSALLQDVPELVHEFDKSITVSSRGR